MRLIIILISSILLTSCGPDGEVKDFVAKTKKTAKISVKPLPKLEEYEQFSYAANKLRDPFSVPVSEITVKTAPKKIKPKEKVIVQKQRPDEDRPREYLEGIPLDSFIMVGTLQKKGEIWALLVDKTGMLHKVREGNYLGENSGQIKKITEDIMHITEIVSDGLGNWITRKTNLQITKNKKQ